MPELINVLSKQKGNNIVRVFADGAYDSNSIFQFLTNKEILPCIRIRKNPRVKETNQFVRNLSVITQRNDFSRWKDSVSYVKRWNVETAISTMKIV
jgi:hypothetical protein